MRSFLSFVLMGPFSTLNHGITVGSHGHLGYSVFVHFGGSGSDVSHLSDRFNSRVLPSVPSHIAVVLSSPTCPQLAHAREVIPYRRRHTLKSTPLSAEQRANHSGRFNSPELWISPPSVQQDSALLLVHFPALQSWNCVQSKSWGGGGLTLRAPVL